MSTSPRKPTDGDPKEPIRRRPYQRPRILERESLEAMAADCAIPGGKSDSSCVLGFS